VLPQPLAVDHSFGPVGITVFGAIGLMPIWPDVEKDHE
jgi:hypothetical protein